METWSRSEACKTNGEARIGSDGICHGQLSDVPAARMGEAKGGIVEDDGQRMHTAGELEGKKIYWMGFVRS